VAKRVFQTRNGGAHLGCIFSVVHRCRHTFSRNK
jgi:hypothetical protein